MTDRTAQARLIKLGADILNQRHWGDSIYAEDAKRQDDALAALGYEAGQIAKMIAAPSQPAACPFCRSPDVHRETAARDEWACYSCLMRWGTTPGDRAPVPNAGAAAPKRCEYCDDTGDVHSIDGEWRGRCTCAAGAAAPDEGMVLEGFCSGMAMILRATTSDSSAARTSENRTRHHRRRLRAGDPAERPGRRSLRRLLRPR